MSDLLADADVEYLTSKGFDFEAQLESNMISLVIKRIELPHGYEPREVDLLLRLPLQFPEAAPDMFWTDPVVCLIGGGVPSATELRENYVSRSWQRWSRHFGHSHWRPGTDDLRSYIRLIVATLQREAEPRAA